MKISEMVEVIDKEGKDLTTWEVNFIAGFVDKNTKYFSVKQAEIVTGIYDEKC